MEISDVTRAGVVLPVRVDPAGLLGPTPKAARGPHWRRAPGQGWFLPTDLAEVSPDQRIVEAMAGMPSGAAVTGWAALWWLGGRWFGGLGPDGESPMPVPISLGDRRTCRRRTGVVVVDDWLFADDVVRVDGMPITVPERAVSFEARRARTLPAAVVPIDMAAHDDLIDLEGLAAYVERLTARPGVRRLRRALGHASENSWSPQEPLMAVAWERATRVVLRHNAPIFDSTGRHVLTPDLLDAEASVAGEYDGRIHLEDGVRRRDLEREAAYREHGIELVTMMSTDRRDTTSFLRRLRAAYARAEVRTDARSWTLDQPEWWVDTSTVAARRALTSTEREIWLRHRRT